MPRRGAGRDVHRRAAQQRGLRRDRRAYDDHQRARPAHQDHHGRGPGGREARLPDQDRGSGSSGGRLVLRRAWRDAHAGRHRVDEAHPGRGLPRPARGPGLLLRRDPHHVPDRLVRRTLRDAGLDRAELHGHVPAQDPEEPLSLRSAALALVLLAASPARAVNHLIAIDEVLGSWQGDDSVQFVQLRMLAAGQQFLSDGGGTRGPAVLVFDDASGSPDARRAFTFTHDPATRLAGPRLLLATPGPTSPSGFPAAFLLPPGIPPPGAGPASYLW